MEANEQVIRKQKRKEQNNAREAGSVETQKQHYTARKQNKTKTKIEYEPFRENCTIFKAKIEKSIFGC